MRESLFQKSHSLEWDYIIIIIFITANRHNKNMALALWKYERGKWKQSVNIIFRNCCRSIERWDKSDLHRERRVGKRKGMSKGKETPESKRPLETRILVCLEGTTHVEIQWCMTIAERKNLGTSISHWEVWTASWRKTFQTPPLLGRAKIFLIWRFYIDFSI